MTHGKLHWLKMASWTLGFVGLIFLMTPSTGEAAEPNRRKIQFFESKIRPVLVKHCYECHSSQAKNLKGNLRLDYRGGIRKGGDSGPAVVPGEVNKSLLIQALRYKKTQMPPQGKLPQNVINNFVRWVRMGAPDPRDESGPSPDPASADKAENLWSLQPLRRTEVPSVKNNDWPKTDIDRFILNPLEKKGLTPVEDADRRSLIRRAYFDLIGLPPQPEEVEAFVNDNSPRAFEKVVDRLLASPRFGERWGRHWLDVVRFAESTGHERNFTYPHAWRYRDYVIESFNKDKPYDQFVREQIAGDLLPAENRKQAHEQGTATGFLSFGPKNLIMGGKQYEMDVVDDQINVTTRAFLGLTVSCARCHDHKFDPIPTKDYYALAGIFLSTETLHGTQPGTGAGNNRHPADLLPVGPNAEKLQKALESHQQKVKDLSKELKQAQNRLKKLQKKKKKSDKEKKNLSQAKNKVEKLKADLKELKENRPPAPDYAMAVKDVKKPSDTKVLKRGNIRNRGETVPRGFLSALEVSQPAKLNPEQSGRLELAHWLTSPENPLTPRVMVNRIWHHLFGRGLVSTVDNFGVTGKRPTHPKLLDALALQFRNEGWSIKQTIRRIMLSRVYQLSADYNEQNAAVDADNTLLWRMRPRRLEAEAIRDAMLSVSGRLDLSPPPHGSVVAKLGDGCLVRQIDVSGLDVDSNRRSIYLPVVRYFLPEMFQVFDGAPPSLVVGRRDVTTVPSQALFLLNNEFVLEQSRAMAQRLLKEKELDEKERVQRAYRLALARPPQPPELQNALNYLEQAVRAFEEEGHDSEKCRLEAWAGFCQALFTSAEFRYLY